MTATVTVHCFGFHQEGQPPCTWCSAGRRCKAVQLTHGTDILADLLSHLTEQLPDVQYEDSDRVTDLVKTLRNPKGPSNLDREARAIGLRSPTEDEPDIDV